MTDLLKLGQSLLQKQPFSLYLGTELIALETGRAVLALNVHQALLQQHGFVHGGVISYLIDNALTFAGGSVLGEAVVTAEFKLNYARPAKGERLIARATVEESGKRLAVCRCDVTVVLADHESRCAIGQGTIVTMNPDEKSAQAAR